MTSVASFYNKIAKVYPVLDIFLQDAKRELIEQVNREKPGALLEIGVGRGDNLPRYVHRPIVGIDVSEGMLAYAHQQCPAECELHIMDASAMAFDDERFDYCVISHVLTVVNSPEKVMNEAYRVLKPGGKVFIINHESTGPIREKLNRKLAPMVSRLLHFSAVFDMDALVDPLKFVKLHKARHGLLPSVTLMVLQKHAKVPAAQEH